MENLSISISLGGKVMDNMKEMRSKVQDGKYNLTLEVAEGAYFGTYDDVDTKSGEDLVRNYLRSNSDDANFNDIKITKFTKEQEMIKLANNKEDVNVSKMYGTVSTIPKEEFMKKYKVNLNRSFVRRSQSSIAESRI